MQLSLLRLEGHEGRSCADTTTVCVCVCVRTGFCYLFRAFSGINTDHEWTSKPHRDLRPVLKWHDFISEVLVEFLGKV